MNTLALTLSSPLWWPVIPAVLVILYLLLGITYIGERQVGIVVKRFGLKNLPPGQIIALDGEAGIQADTLTPGLHFFYWIWQYSVTRTAAAETRKILHN